MQLEGSVRVPNEVRAGLRQVLELDQPAFDRLRTTLRNEPAHASLTGLTNAVIQGLAPTEPRRVSELVDAMFWLVARLSISDSKPEEFAVSVGNSDDLALTEPDRQKARQRFADLLTSDALVGTYKAFDLLTEHDHVFLDGRIVTDIRPVFRDAATQPPLGAVIVHTLKITYGKGHDHFDYFVALDDADLNTLQKAIGRAVEKASTLRQLLQRSSVQDLSTRSGT
jgi:hypothetical protein